jgi:hypothetical protein
VRATGIAVTYGLATAIIGGTAPLVGSLLVQRGVPLGIPAYLAVLSAAGLLAAVSQGATAPLVLKPPVPATATPTSLEPPAKGSNPTG